ncbi:Uncharacterized protein OBRU01_20672, partial [Operophtera brumata]
MKKNCYGVDVTAFGRTHAKRLSKVLLSFSVYTNTRRLITYNAVPGAIECLDGVRSFAMMWWITSAGSVWITMGPITVDTFFMLSGLLLVYTTAGKMSR